MVLGAAYQQTAAVPRLAGFHFIHAHPQGTHYAGVQCPGRVVRAKLAGECKAQIGDVFLRVFGRGWFAEPRQVNTYQRGRCECISGFFQHLADTGLQRRLARVSMTGRVVEHQSFGRVFFDQKKAPILFDDAGLGHTGFPTMCHSAKCSLLRAYVESAMILAH